MGTVTAQILIGSAHPNHGGILPTHFLFLIENDHPSWILVNENFFKEGQGDIQGLTWIPTVENTLEDAILMTTIHVSRSPTIIELAKRFNSAIEEDHIQLYSALDESQRKQLYLQCRSLPDLPKVVISVLRGSMIDRQFSVMEQYKMDVEICRVVYSRLYSPWTNKTRIEGSLNRV
ncbi:MAG TPA: hypothetical protein PKV11_06725 [Smithella sp.]|nr:hypothetical protein [Smithella sp.]